MTSLWITPSCGTAGEDAWQWPGHWHGLLMVSYRALQATSTPSPGIETAVARHVKEPLYRIVRQMDDFLQTSWRDGPGMTGW